MKSMIAACALMMMFCTALPADAGQTSIVYASNLSAPAVLRCRPGSERELSACAIFLPPHEHLNPDKISGDTVRWVLQPETFGPGGDQAVLFVRERTTDAHIATTIYLMTDAPGGVYRVFLVADPGAPPFSEVHFEHKLTRGQQAAAVRAHAEAAQSRDLSAQAIAAQQAQLQHERVALSAILKSPCQRHVSDAYSWDRDNPLSPQTVFVDDENHTCIQWPERMTTLPGLPYVGPTTPRWRVRYEDRMVIVDGLLSQFDLRKDGTSLHVFYKAR